MFLFRGKNSTIKKLLFTKLFLEEPEPKEFLYCESDASPEIPGIYYKKQAPVHDTPFVDNLFPTNEESITFFDQRFQSKITENNYKIPDGNKKWLIPHEMNKKKKYFLYDSITAEDVHQGQLANIYFLNCLISLASKNLIERLFEKTESNTANNCYALKTYIQGKQKIVAINDYFPCLKSKFFAFSYAGPSELWVPVVEKVWAKINRSYAMTLIGSPMDPFSAFCEAPCIEYNHMKYKNKDEIYNIIIESLSHNYNIFSAPSNNEDAEKLGLFHNHSYNIIKIKKHNELILLQLQNKWGGYEWKGDYSDNSEKWTDELKLVYDMKICDEGIFFIKIEDYLKYFPKTYILKFNEGWKYGFKKFNLTSAKNAIGMKLIVNEHSKIYITLHVKQERFNTKIRNYKPFMSKIFLAKPADDDKYIYIKANSGKAEKLVMEAELGKGEYHVFVSSNWDYFLEANCSLVVSTYSDKTVSLEELNRDLIPNDFVFQIIKSGLTKNKANKLYENMARDETELQFYVDNNLLNMGYYVIYINNLTNKTIAIDNYTISYTDSKVNLLTKMQITSNNKLENNQSNLNIKTYLKIYEEEYHIIELLDEVWDYPLTVSKPVYHIDTDIKEVRIHKFIEENLKETQNKKLNDDLIYYELETNELILLVFKNVSDRCYKLKVDILNLQNLFIDSTNKIFNLSLQDTGSIQYIKLQRDTKNFQQIDFKFKYKYKCIK